MATIEKTVSNEIKKWRKFYLDIFSIEDQIKYYYYEISLGDYDTKKKSFERLHFLKMAKYYIYLKIYHNNIKKTLANDKLLKYFESVLTTNGFNVTKLLN